MPAGGDFRLLRRLRRNGFDLMPNMDSEFYPPNSTTDWPKTFGGIGHSHIDLHLAVAENRAAGSKVLRFLLSNCSFGGRSYIHR